MTRLLRIGVADDEPIMLTYYQKQLSKMGHEVVVHAEDGQSLLQQCVLQRPDLVVSDIRMPKLDGIAAAERLWQEAGIPTILVSAHHDPETIGRAQAAYAMAFLVKPIKKGDLEAAVAIAAARITTDSATLELDRSHSDGELASLASARLGGSGYLELESVRCSAQSGEVALAGKVSSFYLKQLAQTLVGQLPGIKRIHNRLEVRRGQDRTSNGPIDSATGGG